MSRRSHPHTEAGYYAAPGMYPPSVRINPHTEAGENAAPGMYPKYSQQPRLLEQRWRNTDTVTGKYAEPGMYQQYQTAEVPSSKIESLERTTSRHLRKWLGIPPSFSSVGLYGKSNQLRLPLSSLVEDSR